MKKDPKEIDRTLKESIINKGYLEVRRSIDDDEAKELKDKLQNIIIHNSKTEVISRAEFRMAVEMINQGVKHQSQVAMQVTQNPEMDDNDTRGLQMIDVLSRYIIS